LLDDVHASHPTNENRGNAVLGEIFGSKDVSRAVAHSASAQSGLDPSLLKKMLPMLAMLAAGYLAKQRGAGAGAATAAPEARSGFGSLLDMDRDGNPLDDILRMGGGLFR
jgi:hypothetical protein